MGITSLTFRRKQKQSRFLKTTRRSPPIINCKIVDRRLNAYQKAIAEDIVSQIVTFVGWIVNKKTNILQIALIRLRKLH
jgi:hypothetical protein